MTSETPILDRLIHHAGQARGSLHVPGHHSGQLLPERLSLWLGAAAKLDLTELPGLDNLASPDGCIAASQRLAASYYGADETLYCVGGSTQGILTALFSVLRDQGEVLFLNPFHQSAWHGLILRDAWPRFAPVRIDESTGCSLPPTPEEVKQTLRNLETTRLNAVFLTSPTYEGAVADVKGIASVVHDYGLPLIVDEAHGAHLGLCDGLPPHSVSCGADIVIQSVHKMLPGLTQTAWLHIQGGRVDKQRVIQALRTIQSTSPSYLLLASLDVVQHWLRTEGPQVAAQTLARLQACGFVVDSKRDPLKLWLPTGTSGQSQAIASELASEGIFVEYANPLGILMICGLSPPPWLLARVERLFAAQEAIVRPDWGRMIQQRQPELLLSPRQAHDATVTSVALSSAEGRVTGRAVTPYPPGVPILFPGQRIDAGVVHALQEWQASGCEVHGLTVDGQIYVVEGI